MTITEDAEDLTGSIEWPRVFPTSVVRARVLRDATGHETETLVLLTPSGVLEPVLDYCLHRSHDRSLEWVRELLWAIGLFLQYLSVNPLQGANYLLFLNFAQRLKTGTFSVETGFDPSGLCWKPITPRRSRKVVALLTGFFEHLEQTRGAAPMNPKYAGDAWDRMMDEVSYLHARERAFLGHAWEGTSSRSRHLVRSQKDPNALAKQPPAFPEDHFHRLITEGFRAKGKGGRLNIRNILITLLLHGAGFRSSEVVHLYVSDVMPDPRNPKSALVFIHHPSLSAGPADWQGRPGRRGMTDRATYLRERWGLAPRSDVWGSRRAGWKGGGHERIEGSLVFRAYWFEPEYGELFLQFWHVYLAEIALLERRHPFAFVNTEGDPLGGEYKLGQYNKAHAAAVKKIGLIVSKAAGTTPHGHRHAYGRRLVAGGVSESIIQRNMHHSNIESQKVYTQPTEAEVHSALQNAAQRLSTNEHYASPIPALRATLKR